MTLDNKNKALKKAQERVEELKGFYNHLITFTIINLLILIAVLFLEGDLLFFFIVSVLGWGIGLFIHAIKTFQWNPFTGKDWEQRKIQELLREEPFKN
ncbi:MAG: 2TM domain-containing protein [Nonlabens sp.]|uniref:2TM domain-containing protein n=1 Tax=Nonlabens sp. TaxID=1888209 RepID=UPI00321A3BAE